MDTTVRTVGELRDALKEHDDNAPIGIWSWIQYGDDPTDTDDVQYHAIQSIDTGWHLNNDIKTVNIQIAREIIKGE